MTASKTPTVIIITLAAAVLMPMATAAPTLRPPVIATGASDYSNAPVAIEGSYIVWYASDAKAAGAKQAVRDGIRATAEAMGAEVAHEYNNIDAVNIRGLSEVDVATIEQDPAVVAVVQDLATYPADQDSIPLINALPGPGNSQHLPAGVDGANAKVCIVDTGIRPTHTFFSGRVSVTSSGPYKQDLVDNDYTPYESGSTWHGTHVAGTAAGGARNIWSSCDGHYDTARGVAPGATIIPIRVLGPNGGRVSDVAAAVEMCVDLGADVINLSLGIPGTRHVGTCPEQNLYPDIAQINNAWNAGVVAVTSSGNNKFNGGLGVPACADRAVSVGAVYDGGCDLATTQDTCSGEFPAEDDRACFSNSAKNLKLTAPGSMITSAYAIGDDYYARASGTSMAAPHVTGLIALLASEHPVQSPTTTRAQQIMDIIYRSSKKFPDRSTHGLGRIDAAEAVAYLQYCIKTDGTERCGAGKSCVRGPTGTMGCYDDCEVPTNLFVAGTGGRLICGDSELSTGYGYLMEGQKCWLDCGAGYRPTKHSRVPQCLNGQFVYNRPECEPEDTPVCGRGHPGFQSWRIGDGICDHNRAPHLYNTPECGWDGGDCCKDTCVGASCGYLDRHFPSCRDPGDCDAALTRPNSGALDRTFLDSRRKYDECGVCGGDGSSCVACQPGQEVDDQGNCVDVPQCLVPAVLPRVDGGGRLECGDGATMLRGECELTCNRGFVEAADSVLPECSDSGTFVSNAPACRPVQESDCQATSRTPLTWLGDGYCDEDFNTPECGYDRGDCCSYSCCEGRDCDAKLPHLCPNPNHPFQCADRGDCNGNPSGTTKYDECGVCGGDGTSCDHTLCPADSYGDGEVCTACPANSQSPRGSTQVSQCLCDAGYELDNNGNCVACPVGLYKPQAGNGACRACETGYTDQLAATQCKQCSSCGAGAIPVGECDGSSDTVCQCAAGYHTLTGGDSSCTACPAGTFKSSPGEGSCQPCADQEYASTEASTSCTACTTCGDGATPVLECSATQDRACECPSGYGAEAGSGCEECPAGKFQNSNSQCEDCPSGSYQTSPGQTTCDTCSGDGVVVRGPSGSATVAGACECAAGYEGEAPNCVKCAPGYHKASSGNGQCVPCTSGYASGQGSTQCSQCTQCGAGAAVVASCGAASDTLCECQPGYDSLTNGHCSPCSAGTYKAVSGDASCQSCSSGKYNTHTARSECASCTQCGTGTDETTQCTPTANRQCACSDGYAMMNYADPRTCTACGPGTYQYIYGIACASCPSGFYSGGAANDHCRECPKNTYAVGSATRCTSCPAGYGSQPGADECVRSR